MPQKETVITHNLLISIVLQNTDPDGDTLLLVETVRVELHLPLQHIEGTKFVLLPLVMKNTTNNNHEKSIIQKPIGEKMEKEC